MKRLIVAVMMCAIPLMAAAKDKNTAPYGPYHVAVIPLSQCRADLRQLHPRKAEKCIDNSFLEYAYNKHHGQKRFVISSCARRMTDMKNLAGYSSMNAVYGALTCEETAKKSGLKWQSEAACLTNHPAYYCSVPPKIYPTTPAKTKPIPAPTPPQGFLSIEFGNQIGDDLSHVWHPVSATCKATAQGGRRRPRLG
jgi:hypothetical protein